MRFTISPIALLLTASILAGPRQTVASRASFNPDGSVDLPVGYRAWAHVGTSIHPSGINVLDGKPILTPEVLDAYIEPGAKAVFDTAGKWPEGSQIVKEYSALRTGPYCDPRTLVCTTELGRALYETGYIGLAMMIKDRKRFPDAPGNWGYFSFGHKPEPYDRTARVLPQEQCASCHQRLGSRSDYVITRGHIGLAAKVSP